MEVGRIAAMLRMVHTVRIARAAQMVDTTSPAGLLMAEAAAGRLATPSIRPGSSIRP